MGKDLKDYGLVFRSVAGNPKISKGARLLYCLLCTWRDKETNICFPGTNLLCETMDSNRQRINEWLQELEDHKAIERHTRFDTKSGRKIRTIIVTDDNYEKPCSS